MLDFITQLVVYLLTVSIAAERMTEIFKRTLIKESSVIPKFDGAVYQILSGIFGAITAYTSPPDMGALHLNQYLVIVLVGLAVSGGSGAWNSVLEFLKQSAESKKIDNANQSK